MIKTAPDASLPIGVPCTMSRMLQTGPLTLPQQTSRKVPRIIGSAEVISVLLLLAVLTVAVWPLVVNGMLIGQDAATQFYPWYAFLGSQLRAGRVPGWNPAQFAGAPFAADPQSGWMYLPAMLLFTALPLTLAAKAFLVFHLALAGLATYALARVLGMNQPGALTAGIAFALSGELFGRIICCPAIVEVGVWLPVLLLGAELAIRSRAWLNRAWWWAVAGFAVSQELAAWLGQGAYYALLVLGSYVAYRTLLAPPMTPDRTGRPEILSRRLLNLALHVGAILCFGFALGAAGVLPRLAYNSVSTLAGGAYTGNQAWAAAIGGFAVTKSVTGESGPSINYPGSAAVLLALLALVVSRRRWAVPFFTVLTVAALVLMLKTTTPLHWLLYRLLPRFEVLHRHWPQRIAVVAYFGMAVLAGAAVSGLERWRGRTWLVVATAALPVGLALALWVDRGPVTAAMVAALVAAALIIALATHYPAARRIAPALLVAVVGADLLIAGREMATQGPYGGFQRVNLATYYAPTGAVTFLRRQQAGQPFRFFGYNPQLAAIADGGQLALYRYQFAEPQALSLVVNNRATLFGLQDIQGYDPVQLANYAALMTALNGHAQNYHEANVYDTGLTSPLLDLLNVRYIVVPAATPPNRPDLIALSKRYPTVYADSQVKVLLNADALPRAWIVHAAERTTPGQALSSLAAGTINPRQIALLENPPPLAQPQNPAADRAVVTTNQADYLRLTTRTDAPGLLMLSEVYYPAWQAYVDGKPVPLDRADDLLRAVPVPAGTHTVELRFESRPLHVGIAISLTAAMVFMILGGAAAWRRWSLFAGQPSLAHGCHQTDT